MDALTGYRNATPWDHPDSFVGHEAKRLADNDLFFADRVRQILQKARDDLEREAKSFECGWPSRHYDLGDVLSVLSDMTPDEVDLGAIHQRAREKAEQVEPKTVRVAVGIVRRFR